MCIKNLICVFAMFIVSSLAYSEPAKELPDPVVVSLDRYKVLLENDYVMVVEYTIDPGEKGDVHTSSESFLHCLPWYLKDH